MQKTGELHMYGLKKIYGKLSSLNPISKKRRPVVPNMNHANTESVRIANEQKVNREILKSKANLYSKLPF